MSAPDILDEIKDDLGIPADDATNDDWIARRIAGIWSRIEHYTARALCVPPQAFVDDYSLMVSVDPHQPSPPALWLPPRSTIFLRYFPVVSIEELFLDGQPGTAADVRFDPRNGKLFSLTGSTWVEDLSRRLWQSQTRITYKAGWDEVPGDLYEIVLGCMQTQWAARQAQAAGAPAGGTISGINVIDVGSIEVTAGANSFVQAASKGAGAADPLLGPYLSMLDLYVDHRSLLGLATVPVTTPAPTP